MPKRLAALLLGFTCGLFTACLDDHDGEIDEGEKCSYFCNGLSCNLRCENGVLFRCQEDNRWHLEQDCAAEGLDCELDMPDSVDGTYMCIPPG